jgi:hypothetical protein
MIMINNWTAGIMNKSSLSLFSQTQTLQLLTKNIKIEIVYKLLKVLNTWAWVEKSQI